MTRLRVVTIVLVVAVVCSLAFLAGSVVSPQEAREAAAPPDTGQVTVSVEERQLRETIVGRGLVETFGESVISLPAATASGAAPLVTATPDLAGEVSNGELLVEIAGEPVIALDTQFGPYRDLDYLASGPDVAEVQRSLAGMGHDVDADGFFGATTLSALRSAFGSAGYSLPLKEPEDPEGSATWYLPATSWVSVPGLPRPVSGAEVVVGQDLAAEAGSVVVSSGQKALGLRLDEVELEAVVPGQKILLQPDDAEGTSPVELVVAEVRLLSENDPVTDLGALVLVEGDGLDSLSIGTPGRVEFVLTETEEVLAVPVAALVVGSDGHAQLETIDGGFVDVSVGRSAEGWVEVHGEGLTDGFEVRIP